MDHTATSNRSAKDAVPRALAFAEKMAVGAAAPVELCRSVMNPELRRGFPKYHRTRRRVLLADIAAAAVLTQNRFTRAATALGVATLAGSLAWRSRGSWGTRAGRPPGRLLTGSRAVDDPHHFFSGASRYGSIFKTNHFDEPAACLVGMADATQLFKEQSRALDVMPLAFNAFVPGGLVRWKEGREHDDYRRLFQHIFGQHLIRSNEHILEASIDRMLERIHRSGGNGSNPMHHLPDMVFEAWAELFFGIAPTDPRYRELSALYDTIDVSKLHDPERMVTALDRLEDLLSNVPLDGPMCALNILRNRVGDPHLASSMVRNLIFTLDMTRSDIAGLMQWAIFHAAMNPEFLDELAAHEPSGSSRVDKNALANRMVSETLRLEQSEHLFRRAREEIRVGPYRIPPGWLVRVCTQESHRDASIFPEPDRYDPDRFLDPSWPAAAYAPFGIDGHSCIGEALTRRFTSILLERLARGYDVEVATVGTRQMSEHQHWAPGEEFRVRLVRRAEKR